MLDGHSFGCHVTIETEADVDEYLAHDFEASLKEVVERSNA
jgi:hypothetical protein